MNQQPSQIDQLIESIADGSLFSEWFGSGGSKSVVPETVQQPPDQLGSWQQSKPSPWYNPYDDANRMPTMESMMQ